MKRVSIVICLLIIFTGASMSLIHFQVVYTGNPYLAMNFYITEGTLDGINLGYGDEIGIFDGEYCVGAGVLTGEISNYLALFASTDDPNTTEIDGFTVGNEISYKLWDASKEIEIYNVTPDYTSGDGTFSSQGTAMLTLSGITNQPPEVVKPISDITVDEDTPQFELADLDTVFSDPDAGDALSFSAANINANVSFNIDDENIITISLAQNWFGLDSLWITATDLKGESATDTIKITVNSVNDLPTTPIVLLPLNGTELLPDGYLVWTLSSDVDLGDMLRYHIQLDDSSNFNSPKIDESGIDKSSILRIVINKWKPMNQQTIDSAFVIQLNDLTQFDNLVDNTVYYWRVRTLDNNNGESEWTDGSNNFFFNKLNNPPDIVTKGFNPTDSVSLSSQEPTITWNAAVDPDLSDHPGMLHYTVQISSSITFGDVLHEYQTESGITYIEVDELADDAIFFYRIKTYDNEGLSSDWSEIQVFIVNTKLDPPNLFSLVSPKNETIDTLFTENTVPVNFVWESTDDPDFGDHVIGYALFYRRDTSFTDIENINGIQVGLDTTLTIELNEGEYYWRIAAFDTDSLFTIVPDISEKSRKFSIISAVSMAFSPSLPEVYSLYQNYPNPFNPTTTIKYEIPEPSHVQLTICNLNGQVIKKLVAQKQEAGFYAINWNASNMSSGVYIYRIQAGTFSDVRKCLLIK